MSFPRGIYLGFDPREAAAFAVARDSIDRGLTQPIPIYGLVLDRLRAAGLYRRPTESRLGRWVGDDGKAWSTSERVLWDVISQWTMATEFAISRFLVPRIARSGLALFADCDVLARGNVARLFDLAQSDRTKALWCVKHGHIPTGATKMDGQVQSAYSRKNWSSVMLFNVDHPANDGLTVDVVNTLPGRDLHAFCWLNDDEIGDLGPEWNWLAGEQEPLEDPKIVHHTLGSPCMVGYENAPYADEWRAVLARWAEGTLSLPG
jgi:hypothetical protein